MTINTRKSLYFLFKSSLPIIIFFQLSGCASIICSACINPEGRPCSTTPPPYVGVAGDLHTLFTNDVPFYAKPLVLIDLPFSFVMDTVLLPIMIPNYIKSKKVIKPKDSPSRVD